VSPVEDTGGAAAGAPARDPRVAVMREHGIVNPEWTLQAATNARLPLEYACALLDKETGGGHNEWGHDPTIFVGGYDAATGRAYGEAVSELGYHAYKILRGSQGQGGMQGVGPCQLTYYSYQDAADSLGGCWQPLHNMTVGFNLLRSNIGRYGEQAGAAAYNGSGPAAEAYGADFVRRAAEWRALLHA
jgi:hypothetical protein